MLPCSRSSLAGLFRDPLSARAPDCPAWYFAQSDGPGVVPFDGKVLPNHASGVELATCHPRVQAFPRSAWFLFFITVPLSFTRGVMKASPCGRLNSRAGGGVSAATTQHSPCYIRDPFSGKIGITNHFVPRAPPGHRLNFLRSTCRVRDRSTKRCAEQRVCFHRLSGCLAAGRFLSSPPTVGS